MGIKLLLIAFSIQILTVNACDMSDNLVLECEGYDPKQAYVDCLGSSVSVPLHCNFNEHWYWDISGVANDNAKSYTLAVSAAASADIEVTVRLGNCTTTEGSFTDIGVSRSGGKVIFDPVYLPAEDVEVGLLVFTFRVRCAVRNFPHVVLTLDVTPEIIEPPNPQVTARYPSLGTAVISIGAIAVVAARVRCNRRPNSSDSEGEQTSNNEIVCACGGCLSYCLGYSCWLDALVSFSSMNHDDLRYALISSLVRGAELYRWVLPVVNVAAPFRDAVKDSFTLPSVKDKTTTFAQWTGFSNGTRKVWCRRDMFARNDVQEGQAIAQGVNAHLTAELWTEDVFVPQQPELQMEASFKLWVEMASFAVKDVVFGLPGKYGARFFYDKEGVLGTKIVCGIFELSAQPTSVPPPSYLQAVSPPVQPPPPSYSEVW